MSTYKIGPVKTSASGDRSSSMDVGLGRQADKVLEELRPFDRQKALGMELHAVELPGAMPHSHDLIFVGPGRDSEIRMAKARAFNHQAMVSCCFKWIGQAAEDSLAVMMD